MMPRVISDTRSWQTCKAEYHISSQHDVNIMKKQELVYVMISLSTKKSFLKKITFIMRGFLNKLRITN